MKTFELEMNSLKTTASDLQLEKSRCCFEKNTQQQYNYGDCLFSVCLLSVTSTDTDGRTLEIAKRKKNKNRNTFTKLLLSSVREPFLPISLSRSFTHLGILKEKLETGGSLGVESLWLGLFGLVVLSWRALQSNMCLRENHH